MAQAEAAAKVGILYEGVRAYMRWKERCEGGVCSCGVQGMSPIKLRACHSHALINPSQPSSTLLNPLLPLPLPTIFTRPSPSRCCRAMCLPGAESPSRGRRTRS